MKHIVVLEPRNVRLFIPDFVLCACIASTDKLDTKKSPSEQFWAFQFESELCLQFVFESISRGLSQADTMIQTGATRLKRDLLLETPINQYGAPIIQTRDSQVVLGTITFKCIFVGKTYPTLKFHKWSQTTPMYIGHRGSGANHYGQEIRENTIASFQNALMVTNRLAGIEMDVMLTADKKLVVYHDIEFPVPDLGKSIPVCLLNYSQMCSDDPLTSPPLLGDVLSSLPVSHAGIVLELKYVSNLFAKQNPHISRYTRSDLVNRVLDCLCEHYAFVQDRWIVFSSFDPDICLQLKHALTDECVVVHNVWIGHEGEEDDTVDFSDIRNRDWVAAVMHSKCLLNSGGLAVEAAFALGRGKPFEGGLPVLSYGQDNLMRRNIETQSSMGVIGFFIDDMRLVDNN